MLGAGGRADGLVVLLRGGVVAWLRATQATQSSLLHVSKSDPEALEHHDQHQMDPERAELVRLFANIISQHLSEEAA